MDDRSLFDLCLTVHFYHASKFSQDAFPHTENISSETNEPMKLKLQAAIWIVPRGLKLIYDHCTVISAQNVL